MYPPSGPKAFLPVRFAKRSVDMGVSYNEGYHPKMAFALKATFFLSFWTPPCQETPTWICPEQMGVAANIAIPKERLLKVARCLRQPPCMAGAHFLEQCAAHGKDFRLDCR